MDVFIFVIIVGGLFLLQYGVGKPSERDRRRAEIQEEIWDLERKQNASYTSYSPSRQDRIDYLTQLLKEI